MIFALRFPNDRIERGWHWVQGAALLTGVAMAGLTLAGFGNMIGFRTEEITEISFAAGLVVDAAVLVILLLRRRTLPPHEERRLQWVIWGCAIGLPMYIVAELCQSSDLLRHVWGITPSFALIGLLYLPNGVLAYLASQAVWQQRVVSVAIPLRHGTIITVLSLAVGVPIIQLHEELSHVQESLELPGWVWPLVVAPVVLFLLNRLHEIVVELVDRFFNRKFHAVRHQLEVASESDRSRQEPRRNRQPAGGKRGGHAAPVVGSGLPQRGRLLAPDAGHERMELQVEERAAAGVGCGRAAQPGGGRAGPHWARIGRRLTCRPGWRRLACRCRCAARFRKRRRWRCLGRMRRETTSTKTNARCWTIWRSEPPRAMSGWLRSCCGKRWRN